MTDRIDETRVDTAKGICNAVCDRTGKDGRFLPPEAFFAESAGYRSEHAATLAVAGHLLKETRFIETAGRMFDALLEERVDDMWSVGWWCAFPIYRPVPLIWKEQNSVPDARYTALTLYSLGLYHRITGDDRYIAPGQTALKKMLARWNWLEETRKLHLTADAFALAILGWEHTTTEYSEQKQAILDWAASTFPEAAPRDFPFAALIRTMLLLGAAGTKYLKSVVKPSFDALLAAPRWRFDSQQNDFRHIESTDDHVDIRGNGGAVGVMRLYDLAAGEQTYTSTPLYRHLSSWMDSMISDHGLGYGCRRFENDEFSGMRYGLGSPAQYIQLWWMLGGFGL